MVYQNSDATRKRSENLDLMLSVEEKQRVLQEELLT